MPLIPLDSPSQVVQRAVRWIGVSSMIFGLAGCAVAPRGPAATLADAGVSATSSFGSDVRKTSDALEYADLSDSFTTTWERCTSAPKFCKAEVKSNANYEKRHKLAEAVLLRERALSALGGAYTALKQEADYDAKADLAGATKKAIGGVNDFAGAIAAIGGAAPAAALISQPITAVAGVIAGNFAEQAQRKRIVTASRQIGAATQRLRDAMTVEAYVFDSLAQYLEDNDRSTRAALLKARLISNTAVLGPLAQRLGVALVDDTDARVDASPALQQAVQATLIAQSRAQVALTRQRYSTAIAALDALISQHENLEKTQTVSLDDVARLLAELDASLKPTIAK